ncbi:MAG: hypothetical protein K0S53_976 [Bacteroidetes bacterium]|jgi:hypothetical protein|nr:hypothetical protein [Bacteroidota bacterium]
MSQNKFKIISAFFLVFGLFAFISLNRHSVARNFTYHSELWADKAGYNVYLPALFIYDFKAEQLPGQIEVKTGNGFHADSTSGKIITKYPYGVSLLQSPFWLMAHVISTEKDGYSFLYQKSIDIAGSFYLSLGLFFLFFTLRKFRPPLQSIALSMGIILSTGIFYYGIFETGMSHVYSFACLSAILYFAIHLKDANYKKYLMLILLASILYIIIRPLNLLFLIPILLYFYFSTGHFIRSYLFSGKFILVMVLLAALFIIPQLLYYQYAFGSYFTNSYQNEPFVFPSFNRILILLFGSDNGLFIYYPILVVLLFYLVKSFNTISRLGIGLLLMYVLIYASWWSLSLGCGFGHRAINDIVLILFVPIFTNGKKTDPIFLSLLVICSLLNIKFMFSYDSCLFTSDSWNYTEYLSILFGEFK